MENDLEFTISINENDIADSLPAALESFGAYVVPRIFNYYLEGMLKRPGNTLRVTCPEDLKGEVGMTLTIARTVMQGYTMRHTEEQIYELSTILNDYEHYLLDNPKGEELFINIICKMIYEVVYQGALVHVLLDNLDRFNRVTPKRNQGVYKFKLTYEVF